MPHRREPVTVGVIMALAAVFATMLGAYALYVIISETGHAPTLPPQLNGAARWLLSATLILLAVLGAGRAVVRSLVEFGERQTAEIRRELEALRRAMAEQPGYARTAASFPAQRVYVSRGEITGEIPPTPVVDPDVIQLGARISRRLRGDEE